MTVFLKISVLFLCTVILFIISCCFEHRKRTCFLLSFFVSAGITTFFSEDALFLSILCALGIFLLLSVSTVWLSKLTKRKTHEKQKHKIV